VKRSREKGLFAFVVQKHRARTLHYDFRLEVGGVMPSWAIPKGPSLDPAVKRLAMPTEDHDMEYRHFEGVIGEGYGAGAVMIWDEGTFTPEIEENRGVRRKVTSASEGEEVVRAGLRDGNLKFTLYGKKLRGSFALVRTTGFGGMREAWLMIKHRDEYCLAGYDAADYDFSAVSGRSLSEISEKGS
jgi:bifunctional non-homologous end joining protein LigD